MNPKCPTRNASGGRPNFARASARDSRATSAGALVPWWGITTDGTSGATACIRSRVSSLCTTMAWAPRAKGPFRGNTNFSNSVATPRNRRSASRSPDGPYSARISDRYLVQSLESSTVMAAMRWCMTKSWNTAMPGRFRASSYTNPCQGLFPRW